MLRLYVFWMYVLRSCAFEFIWTPYSIFFFRQLAMEWPWSAFLQFFKSHVFSLTDSKSINMSQKGGGLIVSMLAVSSPRVKHPRRQVSPAVRGFWAHKLPSRHFLRLSL